MEWNQLMGYAVIALGGSALGYMIGTRKARVMKKRMIQQLNSQSLDLLDSRALKNEFDEYVLKQKRKNKVLEVCMVRLSRANEQVSALEAQLTDQSKKHFVELSSTRARAVDAMNLARRATSIARATSVKLKNLQHIPPATAEDIQASETNPASETKKCVTNGAIAVSVIEKVPSDDRVTTLTPASKHESARRGNLGNSNEASMS